MKDFIVLFCTVILGIVIGGFVLSLGDAAKGMTEHLITQMQSITSSSIINP